MTMNMMGPETLDRKSKFIIELQEVIADIQQENQKLIIENGLLRQSSEEQRQLNVKLRLELKELENANPTWERDE